MKANLNLAIAAAMAVFSFAASAGTTDTVAEAACGMCIYKMEGVKGCKTAVKIGDTAYLVTGIDNFNAHEAGLCKTAKHAHVVGEIKDGAFAATKFELVDVAQVAEIACGSCIYKMEGVQGCMTAVKIDGHAYLVEGLDDFSAHTEGLCGGAKKAKIAGNIVNGKFQAAALTVLTIDQELEVACAMCIYEMEGVKGCQPAVKIDGVAYLVKGLDDFNAHEAGLCKTAQQAHVLGYIDDGIVQAESLELK